VHPILGFGGQEVNLAGMIRLPLCFSDKLNARNLEIDFLVVDVPTTYNAILGCPTLHNVKAAIALYLLQLQFEADDGSVGEIHGDQRMARQCYLVSIRPLVERAKEHGHDRSSQTGKKARARPPPTVPEALVIHTLASTEPPRAQPEAANNVEQLEEQCPECTVQQGRDITAVDRLSLLSLLREYRDVFAFRPEEMPTSLQPL